MKRAETKRAATLEVDLNESVSKTAEGTLAEQLAGWMKVAGASAGGIWWVEGERVTPHVSQGWTPTQLAAAAAHPEWMTSSPIDSVSVPAPGSMEGWDAAGLQACLLCAALGSSGSGRAVLLLVGNEQEEARAESFAKVERGLREQGALLARDVEIAQLREAAQRRDATLAEKRRMFLEGKVVVFKWRNEPDWPVDYVSPNVSQVLGYDEEAWMSGSIRYADIVHRKDMQRVTEEVTRALEDRVENFTHEDYRVLRCDGQERWLYDHTSLVRDDAGVVTHFLGYILDVTDRRVASEERLMLETKMQQAQKLESLGVLTGGLAHDFNNILVGMLGNADLASKEVEEGSDVAGYLSSISLAARRAADLVRQMLAYSGKGRFHIETVDLRTVIKEMTHLLETAISKKILLRFQFADEAPILRADATQIRQIVMNLITNASDAIGTRNGLVTVRTGVRHCDLEFLGKARVQEAFHEGDYAYLEVTDTGSGMDAAAQDLIFDPFYSTKFAGRGLGLAAVQGIVRGHDGALFLKSSRGGGTTFTLYFPLKSGEVTSGTSEDGSPIASRRAVLVVDDEETVRSVAKKMLERLGLEVVLANDGSEALEVFRSNPQRFDLVLLDLTMPNMGGEECLTELRKLRPEMPTILSSGYTEPKSLTGLGEGHTRFLQKPYDTDQLTAEVRAMLEVL